MKIFIKIGIIIITILLFVSCNCCNWNIPNEMIGSWHAKSTKITVRTEPQLMHFKFVSEKADVNIEIRNNRYVNGNIGMAKFEGGVIEKNYGLPPSVTGIAYIIRCGKIGTIFNNDPLESKNVEIWLSPIKNGIIEAELRCDKFPMAGINFLKSNE